MPIFRFRAYGSGGAESDGTIEAEGPKDAVQKLRDQGLYPAEIRERVAKTGGTGVFGIGAQKIALPTFTRRLGLLVRSGVPLAEALRALSGESKAGKFIMASLRERVMAGAPLSRAMSEHPEVFPEFYLGMIEAGEESGSLDRVLENLAGYLESQEGLRERLYTAMIYPAIMASLCIAVLGFLFMFVIPKIVRIFESAKYTLPLLTRLLIAISAFAVKFWWVLIIVAIAAYVFGNKLYSAKKTAVHKSLMPVLGNLYLARFSGTMGFLLSGGLPILKALDMSGRATGNQWFRQMAREAAVRVREGARLSNSLSGLSPVMTELIATGEMSGRLAEVMGHAARSHEESFKRDVARAIAVIEPAMILAMGVIVGLIVFAVLLPLFEMNQLVK